MPFAGLTLDADADFIYSPTQHGVQREYAADALVDEVFGVAERILNFVWAAATSEAAGVISRSVSTDTEVICWRHLPIPVTQNGVQVLELVLGALKLGQVADTVAGQQNRARV